MTFVQFLILLAIVGGVIAIYVATMYLNKAVAVPEDCKKAYDEAQTCGVCASSGSCSIAGNEDKFKDAIEFMKEVKL